MDACIHFISSIEVLSQVSDLNLNFFLKKNESSEPYKLSHTLNSEKSKQFSLCDTDFTVKRRAVISTN